MARSTDRIVTTHAGSLPRPDDVVDMIWGEIDGKPVDPQALEDRLDGAVAEVVAKQRAAGIDLVSDGELSKPGFSNYINDRFTGFEGRAEFQADDVADFPDLAMRLFATPAMAHLIFSNCVGPVEVKDPDAVHRDIDRLKRALGDDPPETAFMGAISPGQVAFNFPNHHYADHEEYLGALAAALRHEYKAITEAGLSLQIDSPDLAMAGHCRSVGSSIESWDTHLPLAIEALNVALEGIPEEQIRLHVCWGNYAGPHHKDVPLRDIVEPVLKANAGTFYVEGANPRHAHEWEVFKDVRLPDGKALILGVIDVKVNAVEHPRLVAQRLVRLAEVVGRENVLAGTDCGFDTFIRFSQVDPDVAWLKLEALSEGAAMASDELW
ncbi:MAG: 5-methyltetrahydropteroyltriglutamate--homocysteine methyltransferase [Solirubrobacteraceae bacterium]|jgi:5-methyltetrahydropteroyltriglutamate--homocysteine methyltransferase|nr:5-methyltetrahydropteroyltriglutamate--homocysteine methyltransferase [Solirubrobacteraceae bacterium]